MNNRLLLISVLFFMLCANTLAHTWSKEYVEVHELLEPQNLFKLDPLPPQNPAKHTFPTEPTVPLIPICIKKGYLRDPYNCGKFYYCDNVKAIPTTFYCRNGLMFDTNTNSCKNPDIVEC